MDQIDTTALKSRIIDDSKPEKLCWQQRLDLALSLIDDIPEHVSDALRQKANSIADDVHGEVAAVSNKICINDSSKPSLQKAVAGLSIIPEMIYQAFEASFAKAKTTVRQRVEDLMHRFEHSDLEREQIVDELWAVPEEVQQIAATAADEAVQFATKELTEMLDYALQPLPESGIMHPDTVVTVKEQIKSRVPAMYSHTLRAAKEATLGSIEHAVAAVQARDKQCVMNKMVADAILRAKATHLEENAVTGDHRVSFQLPKESWSSAGSNSQRNSRKNLSASGYSYEKVGSRTSKDSRSVQHLAKPQESRAITAGARRQLPTVGLNRAWGTRSKKTKTSASDCPLFYAEGYYSSSDNASQSADSAPATTTRRCADASTPGAAVAAVTDFKKDNYQQRLTIALGAIDALPTKYTEVLQRKTDSLLCDVKEALTRARMVINDSNVYESRAKEAISSLDEIPLLIQTSFEAKFAEVRKTVRQRVDGLVQTAENADLDTRDASKQIIHQLLTIPEEVHQLASEAVEAAVQESQAKAQLQLDEAFQALPEEVSQEAALCDAKMQIMEMVPDVEPGTLEAARATLEAARATAVENVLSALEAAGDNDSSKQFVADALLQTRSHGSSAPSLAVSQADEAMSNQCDSQEERDDSHVDFLRSNVDNSDPVELRDNGNDARVAFNHNGRSEENKELRINDIRPRGPSPERLEGVAQQISKLRVSASARRTQIAQRESAPPLGAPSVATNPGSRGHPELCPRPCLFFSLAKCENGASCDFCHLPHPKRTAHLDKRHRAILRAVPFHKLLKIVLPVLKKRMEVFSLPPDVVEALANLSLTYERVKEQDEVWSKEENMLRRALGAMTVRSLLTTLLRSAMPVTKQEKLSIGTILEHLRDMHAGNVFFDDGDE